MSAASRYSFVSSRNLRVVLAFVGVILIFALGMLRVHTHAQFTFASLMLLPVLINAWLIGRVGGWFSSVLAAFTRGYADHIDASADDAAWILILNALVRLFNTFVMGISGTKGCAAYSAGVYACAGQTLRAARGP